MKKLIKTALFFAAFAPLSASAMHNQGTWEATMRGIYVNPSVSSTLGLDVKPAVSPEVDFSYFFFRNLALELIASMTQHDIYLNGGFAGRTNVCLPC